MTDEDQVISDYDAFIYENYKKINLQFNRILFACIFAGPMIAIGIYLNVFKGVTYGTAVFMSVFMLAVTLIHRLILRKYASSYVSALIAFFAIDVLLIVVDQSHLTIFITWFLIPLLSLQFCDFKIYFISVTVNYLFMVFATWHTAPYFAERRTDVDTAFAYFASRIGGLTIEMIIMIIAGYSLCKMITDYYKKLLDDSKAIKESELQREKAIAASEAKSLFLSNMSHEIRTPINAVLGMNEMILRESADDNITAYSESIKVAGDTLLGLINDVLDFSKIESGKMEIVPVDYDVSSLINDLVNMVRTRADEKGLELILNFDSDIPKILHGDEIRLKQIITNILSNAVKYTKKGNVNFTIDYEDTDDQDEILLNVSVKDTGIGIKEEDLGKLFSEFERLETDKNRNIEGSGLGLSITEKLLKLMGSDLQVESTYGMGSRFYFSIRQKVVNREPLGDYQLAIEKLMKEHEKYRESFTAPDADILVVDDNPMNLVVIKSLLKQTKINVDTAESGKEGVLLSQDKKYDVIFLDHMMPEKDGIETLHDIRNGSDNPNRETPTICLTANAISGAREVYLTEGFDDYLTKPIDAKKLEEFLIRYLPDDKVEKNVIKENEKDNVGNVSSEIPEELMPLKESPIRVIEGIKNSGSYDDYIALLKLFYESAEAKAKELDDLYEIKDVKNYTIKVHALKSSAKIIGATALGTFAQRLENAGKANDVEFIVENHYDFIDMFRDVVRPLSDIFAVMDDKEDAADKEEASSDIMKEAYEKIREAADAMDCDSLEEIIAETEDYRIPASEEEIWNKIKEAVSVFDYDGVLSALGDK